MNRKPDLLFEKFEIETVVKKDEHSAVYLAKHIFLGKRIFLKTLNTRGLSDRTLLQRFKREAKILAKLDHPHVIKVLDFGTFQDQFYISFEYFESENLRQWLKKRSLTTAQKEYLLAQLAQALQFAHEQGIVHRDLKPENILINGNLQLKIADFGLALWNEESNITEATSIVGTPAYMSPEQIRGEKLSHKTDLFNLGLIVFEMFKAKNPFLGNDAGQTLNNILNFDAQELRHSYEDLPLNIVQILDGLLQKNSADRFATADEILHYLPFKEKLPVVPYVNPRKSIVKAVILIAVPLFMILAALIFIKEQGKKPEPKLRPKETQSPLQSLKKEEIDSGKLSKNKEEMAAGEISTKPKVRAVPILANKEHKKEPAAVKTIGQGRLWIECLPWAKVTIDSGRTFTTPLKTALLLTQGAHRLVLRHPAYPSFETQVHVAANTETFFKVNLDTLFGFLDCKVFPWGKIYIDGRFVDDSPLKHPVPLKEGKHKLMVKNPQFPDYKKSFKVHCRDTLRLKVNFSETPDKK